MKVDLTPAELREFARQYKASPQTDLALALADAMEERDKALADLEAARGAIRAVTEEDGLSSDGMPRFVLVPNGSGEDLIVDHLPAVRAAWEGK